MRRVQPLVSNPDQATIVGIMHAVGIPLMVHGSTPNMTPWPRSIFYIIYNSVENTSILHPRGQFRCSAC
jgi:hypothetical protein